MIPSVRTWQVTFYSDKILLKRVYVESINKRFAYWRANEENHYIAIDPEQKCTRVTVSLAKRINPKYETV